MTIDNVEVIGTRIRELRTRAGLTQKGLAEALNVSQNSISRMEDKGSGTTQFLLDLLRFFEAKYDVSCFLQKNFSAEKAKVRIAKPMDTIAVERLKLLQENLNAEVNDLIGLFERN